MRNSGTSSPVEPVRYLSADEVVAMHERLLDRFGGTPGLSDPGLLESPLSSANGLLPVAAAGIYRN